MTWWVVDVEADGRAAGPYSMVSFGAVRFDERLDCRFYGETRPISPRFKPEALKACNVTREQHERFEDPALVMPRFRDFILANSTGEIKLWSDNPAFDFGWINYYLIVYCGDNPFGHTARRIGDMYCGIWRDAQAGSGWREMARTPHTHHPLEDALGHAEALREMVKRYNIAGVDWGA